MPHLEYKKTQLLDIRVQDTNEYYKECCEMYPETDEHLHLRKTQEVIKLGKLISSQKESTVAHLIVTHSTFVKAFALKYRDKKYPQNCHYCAVSAVKFSDGKYELLLNASAAHLTRKNVEKL